LNGKCTLCQSNFQIQNGGCIAIGCASYNLVTSIC
jgi:hypothetical protein